MSTISYILSPEPLWYLVNGNGTAAGGAHLEARSQLNIDQFKPVFTDSGGGEAYDNPIPFDLNGVAPGPFYFEFDSANPDDTYFLRALDAQGNELWTVPNYAPGAGSGGGGSIVTNYIPINNYIANNQFIDHIDNTDTSLLTNLVIAPSNHKGFTPALINPVVGTWGVVGPDIRFVKSSTANTDEISFPEFVLGSEPLTGNVTPVDYVRFVCTSMNAGETYKCFQFPICQKVQNLSNQQMTFTIWAAVTATPASVLVYVRQYFGSEGVSNGGSAEVRDLVGTLNLTTTWKQFPITITIPSVSGKSVGTPGKQTDDDALYIQLEMPLNSPCDILFTKPALYLGDIDPNLDFENYDQINSINSTPRTGDIRVGLSSSAPNGWVAMNDGSIGNVGSTATNRANKDTFQLYSTIYTSVIDTWAPVTGGRTAPGNTMAAAITDFLLNKPLTLPRSLGRALAASGSGAGLTAHVLGEWNPASGGSSVTLTGANLPVGTPYNTAVTTTDVTAVLTPGPVHLPGNAFPGSWSFGTATSIPILNPTTYFNVFIKL